MAEKIPGWIEKILLPQLGELKGEMKAVSGRMTGLEDKMDDQFSAVHSEIRRLDGKIDSVHSEIRRLDGRIDSLDKRIDVSDRLAVVESKIHALETKN